MSIAYFDAHGMLIDVKPRRKDTPLNEDRDVAYNMDALVLNGTSYDLTSASDVQAIPVPDFIPASNILELSYIFKIRCGSEKNAVLIPNFVSKSLELMQASSFLWRRRDYLQVIRNYYRVELFEDGDVFEAAFRTAHPELFSASEDSEHEAEHLRTKFYYENKYLKRNEYIKAKELCPDLVPPTSKGYFQIRARKTKRFLEIIRRASPYMDFEMEQYHFCRKYQINTTPTVEYADITHKTQSWKQNADGSFEAVPGEDKTERVILRYDCDSRQRLNCNGYNDYGLRCVYERANTF